MTTPPDDDDKYNLISPSSRKNVASPRINNKNTPNNSISSSRDTTQLQKKSSEITLAIRSPFPTPPSPIMSSRDTTQPLRQKMEELQKKLKEEQDVKAQLLKNAQDVLVNKKQLREHYLNLVKEKDALEENFKMMQQKASEGLNENYPAGHLFKLKNELESLRREKEELTIKLKEKQDQEAREKEAKKNEIPQKSPELIAKLEENEKIRNQIGEVEKEKIDLENQRAEAQQQQSLHSSNEFHEQESSECFYICAEDARILAQKIKKMQQELWDLGVKHQQLVVNHHHLTTKLDEERQKVMGSAQESNPPAAQEDKEEKELEEEKKEEICYRALSESLFSLQNQVRTAITNEEPTVFETIKKALENIPLEQRPGMEFSDSVKRVSDESDFKKIAKRVSAVPLKPKQKPSGSKISKKKTGQYYSKKKEKKGEKEED